MTTTSDLGYTFWQSLNSNEGWEEKVDDLNLKYKCNTKWMSDRKEIPMEDCADTINKYIWDGSLQEVP
jgi:hypothetical protein